MATVKPRQGTVKVPPTMGGRESVAEPLSAPRPVPRSKGAIILPTVMGVAFLGMMALMLTQPGLRNGTMGLMSLFFPIMMIMSMVSYTFMNRGGGGDKQLTGAQLEMALRDYAMNLDETRDKVQDAARAQHAQFEYLHPEPGSADRAGGLSPDVVPAAKRPGVQDLVQPGADGAGHLEGRQGVGHQRARAARGL